MAQQEAAPLREEAPDCGTACDTNSLIRSREFGKNTLITMSFIHLFILWTRAIAHSRCHDSIGIGMGECDETWWWKEEGRAARNLVGFCDKEAVLLRNGLEDSDIGDDGGTVLPVRRRLGPGSWTD